MALLLLYACSFKETREVEEMFKKKRDETPGSMNLCQMSSRDQMHDKVFGKSYSERRQYWRTPGARRSCTSKLRVMDSDRLSLA